MSAPRRPKESTQTRHVARNALSRSPQTNSHATQHSLRTLPKKAYEAESKLRDVNLEIPKKGSDDNGPNSEAGNNRQTAVEVVRELAGVHVN